MKSASFIVCISLALSGAAFAQQSSAVQGSVSGSAGASANADRNGATATGSAEGTAGAATDDAAASVAQGTELNVTLSRPIDAGRAKPGDEVTAQLSEHIKSDGRIIVRKGSRLVGHVAAARPLSRKRSSADVGGDSTLAIVFDRAVLEDGREIPLNASVQALAAAESRASEGMSDAHGGLAGTAGTAGSVRSSGGGLVGGTTGAVTGTAGTVGGRVGSGAAMSTRVLARSAGAVGGVDTTGRLASGSRGAFGLKGIDVSPASEAYGSALTSSAGNVRLDRGTRMLLVTGSASGNVGLSNGASRASASAAGDASAAAVSTK
jgi:hypothetical protein